MQDNDNNRNKYVTLEGLAKLCEADPFQCAIMCRNVDEMGVVVFRASGALEQIGLD